MKKIDFYKRKFRSNIVKIYHFSYKPQKVNAAKKSRMDQPHLEAPQLLQVRQPS